MQTICGPQIVPPTEKSAKYVLLFKVLMIFQFLIAIADIVAHRSFLRQGLFGLFFLFLIFNAFYKLSYSTVLIYTFGSLFFAIVFLVYILTIIQQGKTLNDLKDVWSQYYLAVACISFVFYLFNAIFCFYPYREFKTIEYSDHPYFSDFAQGSADPLPDSAADIKNPSSNNIKNKNNPEQAPNVDKQNQVKFTVDYGDADQEQSQQSKKKGKSKNNGKNKGTFEVFKGQGVRIG